jgi:hypothetical protein
MKKGENRAIFGTEAFAGPAGKPARKRLKNTSQKHTLSNFFLFLLSKKWRTENLKT